MALANGTRIGVYEIISPLGEGGMGEVYLARDTRLDRHVAFKTLLQSVAGDADRLARFEREAKLLASLNHPHIAQIYGVEGNGTSSGLVMEFVGGPTLADRIASGPVPLDEALRIARQIAAALEAAHDQSIIHRDLKPANIKVRPDGTVKVLDFGLAKLADTAPASGASVITSPGATHAGLVVGTPAYMSPEQARGQAVDARTDLWAFGCVVYEMLTGRRAFDGPTASDAISAVLLRDPDWNALPPDTPPAARRLLRRCLARDVSRRFRHAGDVRLELEDTASWSQSSDEFSMHGVPTPGPTRSRTALLPWVVAAIAVSVGLAIAWQAWGRAVPGDTTSKPTMRLELTLPPGLELFPSNATTVQASPDGQAIAFVGTSGGNRQLYLRRLDAFDAVAIRGTIGATTFTFSPDARAIAFVTSAGELKTASLSDGLVTQVARDASLLHGVAWGQEDQILFTRAGTLWATGHGGNVRQLTTLSGNEHNHAFPSVLPDGRTVLFTVEVPTGSRIEALTLADGNRHLVLEQASKPKYGPEGRLFFYRDGRMLAVGFDAAALRPIGSPTLVQDAVPDLGGGTPVGDVSPAGLMVFPPGVPQRRLVWVSRLGVEEPATGPMHAYMNPRISPDGTRIVVQAGPIWVHDLRRNSIERVSTLFTATNAFPIWMPDGKTVLHRSGAGLRMQSIESGGAGRTLPGTSEFDYPSGLTPDGETLLFQRSTPDTSFDVMTAPVADTTKTTALLKSAAYESGARLSPDGRWLTYVSNESSINQVYVSPFRSPDRRWQVSSDGGTQPVWNPNGREIFYRIADRMMAVSITVVGDEVRLSPPQQLFERAYAYGAGITLANYDVTRDGRFLMVKDDGSIARLRVILNWRELTAAR